MKIIINNNKVGEDILVGLNNKIRTYERKRTIIRIYTHGFVSLISLFALIPSIKILVSNLYSSGFIDYMSVLFSDSKYILSIFGDFAMAILGSIPVTATILVSLFLLIFTYSYRRLQNLLLIQKTANI